MNYHIIVVKEALSQNSVDDNTLFNSFKIEWVKNNFDGIILLKKNKSFDAVILKEMDPLLDADHAISYIRNEIESDINVVVATDNPSKTDNTDQQIFYCKPDIESVVKKVERLEKKTEQQPRYALSYLESVYGNDKQFIIESLEIFNRTVENKIHAMKEALDNKDYKLIAEIAHNIKPSYQMILNEKSVTICNLLNGRETEEKIPHLIDELYSEFEQIKKEIIRDFPKLQ